MHLKQEYCWGLPFREHVFFIFCCCFLHVSSWKATTYSVNSRWIVKHAPYTSEESFICLLQLHTTTITTATGRLPVTWPVAPAFIGASVTRGRHFYHLYPTAGSVYSSVYGNTLSKDLYNGREFDASVVDMIQFIAIYYWRNERLNSGLWRNFWL